MAQFVDANGNSIENPFKEQAHVVHEEIQTITENCDYSISAACTHQRDQEKLIAEVVVYLVVFAVVGYGMRWLRKVQKEAIAEQMKKDAAITKALNEFDL